MRAKNHPLYQTWCGMHRRCSDAKRDNFEHYGAKGVSVCERWSSFWAFVEDMGPKPFGHTLDRIDNSIGYEPCNCRWASITQQNNNKSNVRWITYNGRTQTLSQWANELGLTIAALHYRLAIAKMPIEKAICLPHRGWPKRKEAA